ncbi:23276_t:CDS:2, partial [Cetraspora pellucida]
KELISDMSSYYERCTPIEQQEYCSSLEALLNKLLVEGKTNINKIIDAIKQLDQGIDNEETLLAYNIGSEEILELLYEMQQDTVEDLRHIDNEQMYVQQGEEMPESQ